jgi:hypothetical protein
MAKKRKSKKRAASRKKVRRTRRARGGLKSASLADLHAELERRERAVQKLAARHDVLLRELEEVEREIRANGGVPAGRRRGPGRPPKVGGIRAMTHRAGVRRRPRNKMNLVDALHKVLKGQTMSVTDVSEAVQKAGYKTTSDNFRTIVNQALINNTDKFKKIDRGRYTAK